MLATTLSNYFQRCKPRVVALIGYATYLMLPFTLLLVDHYLAPHVL